MVRKLRDPKRSCPEAFVPMRRHEQMDGSCLLRYGQLIGFIFKSQQFLTLNHLFGMLDH